MPLNGGVPSPIVHLDHDEEVAAAIPSKYLLVEAELVPSHHLLEITLENKSHG